MAFAAEKQVLLVIVITAEFLCVCVRARVCVCVCVCVCVSAKCLFLLRKLNHMEDVETLLQRNSFPF